MNTLDLLAIIPITLLSVLSIVVLFLEAFLRKSEKASYWVSLAGLGLCTILSLATLDYTGTAFHGMVTAGGLGNLFGALFALTALVTILLSRDYLRKEHAEFGEFYLLVLFATLGMMFMASAADLIMMFLGLELMSICLYVLAGFMRTRMLSNESALKYFLLGIVATAFLLYGIALLYGASGTTSIAGIAAKMPALSTSLLFWMGAGFLLVGLAFKVGAVPFHMWVPDVYQGSPTTASGFMATGAKAAAFAALAAVFARQQFDGAPTVRIILAVLSAGSMIVGNVIAISQSNIKRMLAYSSIAHAGYMLAGLAAVNQLGRTGVLFYLVAYSFMNLGAFGVLSLLEAAGEKNLSFDDYAGLGTKRPFLAALMALFMISLAGIPPFAGFFGKYYVFLAAINAGLTWLAILGVLTSAVSVYYYLRLVMVMYFKDGETSMTAPCPRASLVALAIAALAVIELGVYPSSMLTIINSLY